MNTHGLVGGLRSAAAGVLAWMAGVINPSSSMFEAGRVKTSDAAFAPRRMGPNAELEAPGFSGSSAESITAAVSAELNNNELLDGGVEQHIDAVVRNGITLVEPRTGDTALNKQIRELWEMACARADVTRLKSLGEVQALYVRECRRAGEVFVRTVWAPAITVGGVGVSAGPAIELIPSERVPRSLSGIVPDGMLGAGNRVRGGIELNAAGQVEAVWVLKDHPDDSSPWFSTPFAGIGHAGFESEAVERIPIAEITPRFYSRRAAQLRGVSPLCSSLNTIRQLRTFVDASTTTATLAARMGVIMSVPNQQAFANNPDAIMLNADGSPMAGFPKGAGFFFVQSNGQDVAKHVTTIQSGVTGPGFEGFAKVVTRMISRVLRRTPSQVSGDYEQNNFAGARMAQLDVSKSDERDQADVWRMSEPFYRAVVLTGVMRGALKVPDSLVQEWLSGPLGWEKLYSVSVTAPGQGYANPEQEARANASDIAVGIKSRVEACQERGVRYTDVIEEAVMYEVAWREARRKAGLPEMDLDGADKVATAQPTQAQAQPTQAQREEPPAKKSASAGKLSIA